jgi:hypothetical protein
MTEAMEKQMAGFAEVASAAGATETIHSTEMTCNEYLLQHFQQSDSRLYPPGHRTFDEVVPVYQYLFHECIIMHGSMGYAPEPYHLPIRNAYNGVMGEITGGVMTGDGSLLGKDTINWAEWEPKVGDDRDSLEMIRAVTAMRRGPGRDFLVYGRMQRPAVIDGIPTIQWDFDGKHHAIPAVFHAAWTAPDGRFAVALSNWTNGARQVQLAEPRLGATYLLHTSARGARNADIRQAGRSIKIELAPLSIAVVAGTQFFDGRAENTRTLTGISTAYRRLSDISSARLEFAFGGSPS